MSKILAFLAKYGPLVAAFALAAKALLPGAGDAIADQIVAVLGALGVTPDQAVVAAAGETFAAALVLIGVGRKLVNLVAGYFGIAPLFGSKA